MCKITEQSPCLCWSLPIFFFRVVAFMGFGFVGFCCCCCLVSVFVWKEQVQIMVEAKTGLNLAVLSQGSLHCMGLTAFMETLKYPICNFLAMWFNATFSSVVRQGKAWASVSLPLTNKERIISPKCITMKDSQHLLYKNKHLLWEGEKRKMCKLLPTT